MGLDLLTVLIASAGSAIAASGALRTFIRARSADNAESTLNDREVAEALQGLRARLTPPHQAATGESDADERTTATPAELEAMAIMEVYGKELIAEAKRIAKRASAERPSKSHVRQAADRIGILRDRAGVASDVALGLGSILIGGAVSYQVNLVTGGEAAQGSGVWIAMTLAVGVGVVVAAVTIKWRRS